MTTATAASWAPPGTRSYLPGAEVSTCPLCGLEYLHPPLAGRWDARPTLGQSLSDAIGATVHTALTAHGRRIEADMLDHGRDAHGAGSAEEFADLLRSYQP